MEIKKTLWNNLAAVELLLNGKRMVVVTEFGPRISWFGYEGERNLLFWDDEGGRGRGDWKLRGGHRVWIMTPGADESEITYRPDNQPCEVSFAGTEQADELVVWGALDPVNNTRRGLRISANESGDFVVASTLKNDGDMLLSCGIWALTCTLPVESTRYAFPLGDDSGWDTFKSVQYRQWGPCDGNFGDDQFRVGAKTMTITPVGRQTKLVFCIPKGRGVMSDGLSRTLFSKSVVFDAAASYPDGCNWAVYIGPDNFMVEFETMGSYSTLKPGEGKEHVETWTLSKRAVDLDDPDDLMK